MDGSAFRGLEGVFRFLTILCIICVPLSVWKLIDILIWLWNKIGLGG